MKTEAVAKGLRTKVAPARPGSDVYANCKGAMRASASSMTLLLAWAVAAVISSGCGRSGPERAVVSGTVTYQGQPVERGQIRFHPIKGTRTPMWGAYIRNGTYEAYGKGGVPVGTHRVEILAYRLKPDAAGTADSPPPSLLPEELPVEQYLPEKYNTKTELEITIPPGSRKITKDFSLTG